MKKVLDSICKGVEYILIALMAAFSIVIVLQIFYRYVFNNPLIWSEQVARYCFLWGVMLAVPLVYRNNADICFDLLKEKFPKAVQGAINVLIDLFMLGFAGLYLFYSFKFCVMSSDLVAAGIGIKLVYVYAAQPICAFLLLLVAIEKAKDHLKGLTGKGEVK